MKKSCLSIFLFCLACVCKAQTGGYNYYSPLDSVKTSGFYNIILTPELTAHLKTDYSDIRIVNDSGKWVPHVLRTPGTERAIDAMLFQMEIIKKENTLLSTACILKNPTAAISGIKINSRNTQVERFCNLTGSDDLIHWFIINDSILLKPQLAESKYQASFQVYFPPSSYKYFKLGINNKGKEALDIIDAWYNPVGISQQPGLPRYAPLQNPSTNLFQKDSGRISYIKITQPGPYHFNRIDLKIAGAQYFYRTADLYIPYDSNHSFVNPGTLAESFTLSNNSTLQFGLSTVNPKTFYLVIHNDDNPPVRVTEAKTLVTYHVITAYLEQGAHYRLFFDNPGAMQPDYDLGKLKTRFNTDTSTIKFQDIIAIEKKIVPADVKKAGNKWILWLAIGAALIVLLFFTRKMIKEVDKRKQHDSI